MVVILQGYKLTHTTKIVGRHYNMEILHSTGQGINKDTPYRN